MNKIIVITKATLVVKGKLMYIQQPIVKREYIDTTAHFCDGQMFSFQDR